MKTAATTSHNSKGIVFPAALEACPFPQYSMFTILRMMSVPVICIRIAA
jgi:hypothetical protein